MISCTMGNKIFDGMTIILKYQPDASMSAEHDEIYFGDYAETFRQMNKEERQKMDDLGWFEVEESDSWGHFT